MVGAPVSQRAVPTLLADIDIVILAGGLGTRLASVFPDKPKILAPVAGLPILDHQIERLRRQGARRIILALGHLADQVCSHLDEGVEGLDLMTSIEPEPLGTAGAVAHAFPLIRSDHVIVMNGDSLIETDLNAFVSWATINAIGAGLVATRVEQAGRYGLLGLDDHDVVETFDEKPRGDEPGWINAGVYWLDTTSLRMITSKGRGSLERDILPKLPVGRLRAFRSSGRFIDIGTPDSFVRAARWPTNTFGHGMGARS